MSLNHSREIRDALRGGDWPDAIGLASWTGEDRLFRLVRTDPPRRRDFASSYEKGLPRFRQGSTAFALLTGLSMFASEEAVLLRVARPPTYIAELHLREGLAIHVAKTFDDEAHFTVWGDPDELVSLARVVDYVPAE